MQTTTLDFEALILQGITDAGGRPDDINLLAKDDVKSLGQLAAVRGATQRTPNEEPATPDFLPVPQNGEVFELTLDGKAIDPIEMVRGDGYKNADQWEFKGPKVTGTQTKKFKLVSVGYQSNADAVNKALAEHGTPALGQWREAFKKKYARPDGKGPIGFTGSGWVLPSRRCLFPCVSGDGVSWDSFFDWVDGGFGDDWRFVVEVK